MKSESQSNCIVSNDPTSLLQEHNSQRSSAAACLSLPPRLAGPPFQCNRHDLLIMRSLTLKEKPDRISAGPQKTFRGIIHDHFKRSHVLSDALLEPDILQSCFCCKLRCQPPRTHPLQHTLRHKWGSLARI